MNVVPPTEFLNRMRAALGGEYADFEGVYSLPAERAVRVNTLKISAEEFAKISPFPLEGAVPWCGDGFYISEEKPGLFPEHAAGLYYVQEPSAMCAAPLLKDIRGKTVLDLCSAPGGKGTQLAAQMAGEGLLFLNEINFSRAKILSQNVERMGIKNAVVTVASPAALAQNYAGFFDCVLVDAPCSGEGMFRKEQTAIPEWSEQNVEMCVRRQSEILDCAERLLKPGGRIVYSTCTFAEAEDEGQVQSFLSRHGAFTLLKQEKLYPHRVRGEGHFVALLQKDGAGGQSVCRPARAGVKREAEKLWRGFEGQHLNTRFGNLCMVGEALYSLPQGMPELSVQTLRAGVRLGEFTNGRFTPSHSLAMCLKQGEAGFFELDEKSARAYIGGLTLPCNKSGWLVAAYKGYPLGWVKSSGGVAKNHYPKALRLTLQ